MSEPETTSDSWYEATRVASRERGALTFELDTDVCVIGAGLAGLTVAREIARRGWQVTVLEGERVAWAASGRNTGFVLPGFHEDIDAMIERIGLDHTQRLYALSKQGVDYVRRAIEETGMPGVDPLPGWLHVSKTDGDERVRANVERLRWIGAECEAWPTERVREALPNPGYFGAIHYPNAFHIHPLNYALGLAAEAEKAGARIFENTPALSIDPTGVRKRIATPDARVRATHVVLACNVHLGGLMPELAATLLPITTYVLVTQPIPNLAQVIRYRGGISDTDRADNHYRIIGGDDPNAQRLQWSGRVRVWEAEPRKVAPGLARDIRRAYPELGPVEIAHLWGGTLGRAVHRMPQIGMIEPGLWVASGFAGHGLNTTAMAGEVIARGIVDNDETWRLFAPYELVWAGGRLGRALAQGLYWGSRPLARAEEALAQYREQARARKASRIAARLKAEAHKAIATRVLSGQDAPAQAAAEHAAVEHGAAASGAAVAEQQVPGFAHTGQPRVEFGHRQHPPEVPPEPQEPPAG